ncbi:hypothetical protein F4861DRAFT_500010 [Xylaria intraflava]|nr:hypothetical protein F4861DRAFT_500010 [Xylaria intraflava]
MGSTSVPPLNWMPGTLLLGSVFFHRVACLREAWGGGIKVGGAEPPLIPDCRIACDQCTIDGKTSDALLIGSW